MFESKVAVVQTLAADINLSFYLCIDRMMKALSES